MIDINRQKVFKSMLVEFANEIAGKGDIEPTELQALINSGDIVFGVFQDVTKLDGVGFVLIKGALDLESIKQSGISQRKTITAIPCREAAEALAMRQVFGDSKYLI